MNRPTHVASNSRIGQATSPPSMCCTQERRDSLSRSKMKKSLRLLALPLLFAGCVTYRAARPSGGGGSVAVSVSTFEPALSPYGEWVYAENVGRVWRPAVNVVGEDFEPYQSGGHWVYSDEGWMFESDYDWGWAPFHYGRWYREPRFGWVWAPATLAGHRCRLRASRSPSRTRTTASSKSATWWSTTSASIGSPGLALRSSSAAALRCTPRPSARCSDRSVRRSRTSPPRSVGRSRPSR